MICKFAPLFSVEDARETLPPVGESTMKMPPPEDCTLDVDKLPVMGTLVRYTPPAPVVVTELSVSEPCTGTLVSSMLPPPLNVIPLNVVDWANVVSRTNRLAPLLNAIVVKLDGTVAFWIVKFAPFSVNELMLEL